MEKIELNFEIVDGVIKGYFDYEIDESKLPENIKIIKASVESPDLLLGLEEKYLKENKSVQREMAERMQISIAPTTEATIKSQLNSILTDILLSERLGEDTTVLEAQFEALAEEYKEIKNIPPVAYAGRARSFTLPTNSTELSGTATDKDGEVVTTNWTKIEGGNATIVSPENLTTEIKDLEEGTYIFRLTAIDDKGDSAISDVRVTVKEKETEYSELTISPKSKKDLPKEGIEFKVKIKSNANWFAVGKGNSSVSPSSGRGNATVTVRIHQNNSGGKVKNVVEFKTSDGEKVNLVWNQKGAD